MPCPLLQQFQGGLLGAIVGEWVGQSGLESTPHPSEDHGQTAVLLDYASWLLDRTTPEPDITNALANQPTEAVPLVTFPIWLYFHENWTQRQAWLQQRSESFAQIGLELTDLWVMGEVVELVCRQDVRTFAAIEVLMQRWTQHSRRGAPALPPAWHNSLDQVAQWLQQGRSLALVQHQIQQLPITHRPVALALYHFLATPTHFQIALLRAKQMGGALPCGLTGALSGLYNGVAGIPLLWQLAYSKATPVTSPAHPLQIAPLARQLLQCWAGLSSPLTSDILPAVRAPLEMSPAIEI
jgi:hypothetical protein